MDYPGGICSFIFLDTEAESKVIAWSLYPVVSLGWEDGVRCEVLKARTRKERELLRPAPHSLHRVLLGHSCSWVHHGQKGQGPRQQRLLVRDWGGRNHPVPARVLGSW